MCGVDLNLLMVHLMPSSETIRLIAPILGPLLSAAIVASAAIWVGKMITARLGHIQLLNQFNERFHEILETIWANDYAAVRVHARTVEQKYLGPSRWNFLREVKQRWPDKTIFIL